MDIGTSSGKCTGNFTASEFMPIKDENNELVVFIDTVARAWVFHLNLFIGPSALQIKIGIYSVTDHSSVLGWETVNADEVTTGKEWLGRSVPSGMQFYRACFFPGPCTRHSLRS